MKHEVAARNIRVSHSKTIAHAYFCTNLNGYRTKNDRGIPNTEFQCKVFWSNSYFIYCIFTIIDCEN